MRVTTSVAAATAVAIIVLLTLGSIPCGGSWKCPQTATVYHLRVPPFRHELKIAKKKFIEHTSFRMKVIPNR